MTGTTWRNDSRFDRALRVVMWTDAFLSAAVAAICVIASPVVATVGPPHGYRVTLAVVALGAAAVLAACGAITAVLIVLRLRAGQYQLPTRLRLPLPAALRPPGLE